MWRGHAFAWTSSFSKRARVPKPCMFHSSLVCANKRFKILKIKKLMMVGVHGLAKSSIWWWFPSRQFHVYLIQRHEIVGPITYGALPNNKIIEILRSKPSVTACLCLWFKTPFPALWSRRNGSNQFLHVGPTETTVNDKWMGMIHADRKLYPPGNPTHTQPNNSGI